MNDPQYVVVDGARTRYFDSGEGEPIVLVHGGHFGHRASADDWELNVDRLARGGHRVLALDKLGMGFTDNPGSDDGYLIDSHATHLLGFLDALEIDRAHLVGHSRGGYPVTRVAIDHPDRVLTLTVVDSSSVTNPFNPIYEEWRQQAAPMEEREAVLFLIQANSYSDAHITDRLVEVGLEIGRLPKTVEAQQRMAGGLFQRFKADMLERVEQIKADIADGGLRVPTLVFWGFNDPSATIERCAKPAIDQFFPAVDECEMHIVNHAGHYSFREQPEAFADALLGFIQRQRARAGAPASGRA